MSFRRRYAAAILAVVAAVLGTVLTVTPAQAGQPPFRSNISINIADAFCLDIPNSNAYVGQVVQQYWCNGTGAQKWNITYVDYHFEIEAAAFPGLCLNNWSSGGGTGGYIKLAYCDGSNTDNLFNTVGVDHSGYWEMQPYSASSNCANMWGGQQVGNVMRLYPCSDTAPNALFRLFP